MSETRFITPFGDFRLQRLPLRKRQLLRAWDAADEILLQQLHAEDSINSTLNVLIANDSFGALVVALHQLRPQSWSDSFTSHQACRHNLALNDLTAMNIKLLDSLALPAAPIQLVILKVPKSLALLEYQLLMLKPLLANNCELLVAGMVKNMPASVWQLLEKIIGPTQTGRAQKKARVIKVKPDFTLALPPNPYPLTWTLEKTHLTLLNHANVFSRQKLDIGTRILLEHLPLTQGEGDIVDLGCGNGVLGLMMAYRNPLARVHCVDESYMAVASAKENFRQLHGDRGRYAFYCSDGLQDFEQGSVDMVLCNPPFHQSHSIADMLAMSMFKDAARVLTVEGELWIVGNRHLGYHKKLKSHFDRVELIASNKKFVVLKASAPVQRAP